MRIKTRHKDIAASFEMSGVEVCCGAVLLSFFNVNVSTSSVVDEDVKEALYQKLGTHLKNAMEESYADKGLIYALDVPEHGMSNLDGAYASGSYKRCKNMSLGDFCEYHGFARSTAAYNGNTGNKVCVYSLPFRLSETRDTDSIIEYIPKTGTQVDGIVDAIKGIMEETV